MVIVLDVEPTVPVHAGTSALTLASGQQEGLIRVFHKLVKAEDGIVRLHDRVRDLG